MSPREEIGRIAAEQVIARIEGRPLRSDRIDVGFDLSIGESA